MPINKVDYNTNNTVIYKIQCLDGSCDFVYFGSTTNFSTRKSQHKHACNNEKCKQYNIKLYETIRDNGGWNNFDMCLVEVYPCKNKQELVIREQFYIDSNRHDMNMCRAHRTKEQHKEELKEYNKIYNQEHQAEHNKYFKKYNAERKEKMKEYNKKYRLDNKEILKEKKKEYYQDHKK